MKKVLMSLFALPSLLLGAEAEEPATKRRRVSCEQDCEQDVGGYNYAIGIKLLCEHDPTSSRSALAYQYFERAYKAGHAEAGYQMAQMVESGKGGNLRDRQKALELLKISADRGSADACMQYALHLSDRVAEEDKELARRYFKQAKALGEKTADIFLATLTPEPESVSKEDLDRMFHEEHKELKSKADAGDAEAQYFYALALETGPSLKSYPELARAYYTLASQQGHPGACYYIGSKLLEEATKANNGEKQAEALKLLRTAADADYFEALLKLGRILVRAPKEEQKTLGAAYLQRAAYQKGPLDSNEAWLDYAMICLSGTGIKKDTEVALKFLKLAADDGNTLAQLEYGWTLLHQPKREQTGFKYVTLAHKAGIKKASLAIALCYDRGLAVEKNSELALKFFKLAADAGMYRAQVAYARKLTVSSPVEAEKYYKLALGHEELKDKKIMYREYADFLSRLQAARAVDATKYYKLAADAGDEVACSIYGQRLENGWGTQKDTKKALEYYQKAKTVSYAILRSGVILYEGLDGVPKDILRGQALIKSIADCPPSQEGETPKIYADAAYNYYLISCQKDPKTTYMPYLRKAAQLGHSGACYYLSGYYLRGDGVPLDIPVGKKFLQSAADSGHRDALNVLGIYIYNGSYGYQKDLKQAANYFKQAADLKYPTSLHNYAICLEVASELFPEIKDPKAEALSCYIKSAKEGYQASIDLLAQRNIKY